MADSQKELPAIGLKVGGPGMKDAPPNTALSLPLSFVSSLRVSVDQFAGGPGGSSAGSGSPHVITPASAAPDGVDARSISWRYCLPGPCGKENIIQTSLSGEPLDKTSPLSQEAHSSPFALPSPLTFSPTTFPDLLPLPSPLRFESSWLFRCNDRNSERSPWFLNTPPVSNSGSQATSDCPISEGQPSGGTVKNWETDFSVNDAIANAQSTEMECQIDSNQLLPETFPTGDLSLPRLTSPPRSPERSTNNNSNNDGDSDSASKHAGAVESMCAMGGTPPWPVQRLPGGTTPGSGEGLLYRSVSGQRAHFLDREALSFKLPPPLLMPNQPGSLGPKLTTGAGPGSYLPAGRQSFMMPALQTPPQSPLCEEPKGDAAHVPPHVSGRRGGHVPSRFASKPGGHSDFSSSRGDSHEWMEAKQSDHGVGGRPSETGKADKTREEGAGCQGQGFFAVGGTRRVRSGKQRPLHLPGLVDVATYEAVNHPLTIQPGLLLSRTGGSNASRLSQQLDSLALPLEKPKRLRSEHFNTEVHHSLSSSQAASSGSALKAVGPVPGGQFGVLPLDATWLHSPRDDEHAGSKRKHPPASKHHVGGEAGGGGKQSDAGSGLLKVADDPGHGGEGDVASLPWDESGVEMFAGADVSREMAHGGHMRQHVLEIKGASMLGDLPQHQLSSDEGADASQGGGRSAQPSASARNRIREAMGSEEQGGAAEGASLANLPIGDWFFQHFVAAGGEPQRLGECKAGDVERSGSQDWGKKRESDWPEFMLPTPLEDCKRKMDGTEGMQLDDVQMDAEEEEGGKKRQAKQEEDAMVWEGESEVNTEPLFRKGSMGLLEGRVT